MDTQLHPLHSFIKKALLFLQKQLALNVQLNADLAEAYEKFWALKHQNYFVKTLLDQGLSLHQCICQQDIYHVLEKYTDQIFPGSSGYIQVFDSGTGDLCDFYEWGTIEKGLGHLFNEYSLVVDEHLLGKVFLQKKYIESQAFFFPELLSTWLHYVAIALRNSEQFEALRLQTITDPLTGLFNRRYMMDILTRLTLSLSETNSVGVMMIDLDHFKAINDTYGHQAGDSVLKDFSCFLRGMVRPTDIVCRYGGEEFALILPRTPLSTVCERAERICRGLSYLTMKHDHQTIGHITVSIGVAVFPEDGLIAAELIQSADQALYRAKSGGRNRVVAASSGVNLKHVRISPA